ncbi:MAG: ribosomal RNA small subunit methyltransferase A [Fimbriimonadales bacterium]|nr:ribosomal RNA small subunit methyltransferase A [Fimbriimonadales bacterium]
MSNPDLTDPGTLKRFITRHGLATKKGLGQHWLFSSKAVDAIARELAGARGILEIGPGPGVLTQRAVAVAETIALDIDPRVEGALGESAPEARFVREDVLAADVGALLGELPSPRVVLSNLPYYISTAVVSRLLEAADQFDWAVLMMQREVGERLMAKAGDRRRGAISVEVQATFQIRQVCVVPPGAFLPAPKVQSVVLRLDRQRRANVDMELVRSGFKQPRKTLVNNLVEAGFDRGSVIGALTAVGMRSDLRAHHLTVDQWIALANRVRIPKN